MRILMVLSAGIMALLIAVRFTVDAGPRRPFEGMDIVIICGSDEFDEVQGAIADAKKQAIADFGCNVEVVFTAWDRNKEATNVRQYLPLLPSGLCLMGYPGHDTLREEIQEMREQDVAVTSFGVPFDEVGAQYRREGFGYVGPDHYRMGYDLARAAIEKHALQPGDPALIMGDLDHPARRPLRDGYLAALDEAEITTEQLTTGTAGYGAGGEETISALRVKRANGTLPRVLFYTEIPVWHADRVLAQAGIERGDLPLVGIGVRPVQDADRMNRGPENRHISLLAQQDLAVEAYLAILQACMTAASDTPGLQIVRPVDILGIPGSRPELLESSDGRLVQLY